MDIAALAFMAGVFALAGFVKGVVGLGLPTIAMGLLVIAMPPAQAAALLILPSLVTNTWQMWAGPQLAGLTCRLGPMLVAIAIGTIAGAGWLGGPLARDSTALLGLTLIAYAAFGLSGRRFTLTRGREIVAGPLVGLATGLITAATGVFVIPAVPYLQAIRLEKDELVQALGLSFMASTLALAANLWLAGDLTLSIGPSAGLALLSALAGMAIGQKARHRLSAATFGSVFFAGLGLLGLYLVGRGTF